MKTRTEETIRTRADGSIDTAYYMARGRRLRSEAAHAMVSPESQAPRSRRRFLGLIPRFA